MLAKIYQKSIIIIIIGSFVIGCAPKYTASFTNTGSEPAKRYAIEDQITEEPVALADTEQEIITPEVKIKEVIVAPNKVDKLLETSENQVIIPKDKADLIKKLKENPEATVAIKMDRKERKAFKKQMKEQLKEYQKSSVDDMEYQRGGESKLLYYILAVLLPPLAVGLWRGIGDDFWINLLLTLLLFLPGVIHAIIIISNKPKTSPTAY